MGGVEGMFWADIAGTRCLIDGIVRGCRRDGSNVPHAFHFAVCRALYICGTPDSVHPAFRRGSVDAAATAAAMAVVVRKHFTACLLLSTATPRVDISCFEFPVGADCGAGGVRQTIP